MMILDSVEFADFNFLLHTLSLTRGNLSRHMEKLESAGYVKVKKTFNGKIPATTYQATQKGSDALAGYWKDIDDIRNSKN